MQLRTIRTLLFVVAFAGCESDSPPPMEVLREPPILPDDYPDDPNAFTKTVIEPGEATPPDPFTPPSIRPSSSLDWPVE